MGKLDRQFEEDRRLRNTAKAVLMADIDHARTTFSAKGVADKTAGRIGDGAKDVFEVAKIHADDNRGIIAIIIGALLVWLGREPIMEALGLIEEELEKAIETYEAEGSLVEEDSATPRNDDLSIDASKPTDTGEPDEHAIAS